MIWPGLRLAGGAALVPLLLLAAFSANGDLAPATALLAAGAVVAGSLILALIWLRDLRGLLAQLQAAKSGGPAPMVRPALLLPDDAFRSAVFVGQLLSDRTDEVDRLRRAEESILERLPDPLIVLGPDRAVRRANEAARAAFGTELAAVLRHPDLRGAIDRALAKGEKRPQSAGVSIPVPVPREVQATVVKLNSPLAAGAARWWCCRTARASGPSSACAPISWPMPATNYAPPWPA